MSQLQVKRISEVYGLQQRLIDKPIYEPRYGQIYVSNKDTKGGLEVIQESKGKRILNISGGNKKLFILQEENCTICLIVESENVVTALHPEAEDYLVYEDEEVLPIDSIVAALEGNKINSIQSGKYHNIILTDQGLLYTFGKGNYGALGLGGTIFAPAPTPLNKLHLKNIVSIACGAFHSLALSDIGDVYSWGRGFQGQLGLLPHVQSISTPQYVPHFFKYGKTKNDVKLLQKTSIIAIACGSYHSMAIDEHNELYCWGEARYGQTGNGKKTKESIPIKIEIKVQDERRKVSKISGGFGHSMCLTAEGEIFSWGLNIKGQLGLNDLSEHMKTTEKTLQYAKAIYQPTQLTESRQRIALPRFIEIACGFTSSFAIDIDGNAWSWGGGHLGFKDKFLERGPVRMSEGTENKVFTKIVANQDSFVLFSVLRPLYFKPSLVPSSGSTELTFFGNGFTNTGLQSVKFILEEQEVEVDLSFDEKTSTYYCKTPAFEKINKKLSYPVQCQVSISLDKKTYFPYQKSLIIYTSKLQIQSIEPNCGSASGNAMVKIYMPLDEITRQSIESITVGFKNTNTNSSKKEVKADESADWICTEGFYEKEVITCKSPNIPQFNSESPFYMLDVSINGQQFTDMPHTFRYYFITDATISLQEGLDDAEPEITINGKGLFDTPHKLLTASLNFAHQEQQFTCHRNLDIHWNKIQKNFTFKMPKLSWLIGDHAITPDLLASARKSPCQIQLNLSKSESIEIGKYTFVVPPPPPEPEEDKKDAKKDAKKGAKK